jgi:hypothetical protein
MARFTDDTINRFKTEVSLVCLVEPSGLELKKHGKGFPIHCPFDNTAVTLSG